MHTNFRAPAGALLTFLSALSSTSHAQCDRWQQRIQCDIAVDLDVRTHRFKGDQRLWYWNNSPDTLGILYFHLYFNAFRPGSEMDVRSRTIPDPDPRVTDRIAGLKPNEQGELTVTAMHQGRTPLRLEHMGTVLRATLHTPVAPGDSVLLVLDFEGQVPLQIRRSGRDSEEGVAYSMVQWYPKVAQYDHRGWHADPYVGREFYGVWGDHEMKITLDSAYTVAATGVLQNPHEVGHGYVPPGTPLSRPQGPKLTWHFKAPMVHDVGWAADRDYLHETRQVPGGPLLRFFRKNDPALEETWSRLPEFMERAFLYMNEHFGHYPYPEYAFVQGGDGGMEYNMFTLITGKRSLGSLVGVSVHEMVHAWFYGVLASNEKRYAWMDEGFTEYASAHVMRELFGARGPLHEGAKQGYLRLVASDAHEPMSIHADHFNTNFAYGVTAYNKGALLLYQLGYIVGERNLEAIMLRFHDQCAFKHPDPLDLQRVAEKMTGLQLGWYFDQWINTTRLTDYELTGVEQERDATRIKLRRNGDMIMPVDLRITLKDGTERWIHVPSSLMLGHKAMGSEDFTFEAAAPWQWTDPEYSVSVPVRMQEVTEVRIDPTGRMADVVPGNDVWTPAPRKQPGRGGK